MYKVVAARSMWVFAVAAWAAMIGGCATGTKIEGKIKSIAADKNELVVTGKDDAKDHKFQLDLKSKVQLNNKAGKLDDLRTGDEVVVTFRKENGKMLATNIQCRRK